MKSKLLLSAAPIAMLCAGSTMMTTAALAAPKTDEELAIIRCSNNGNGNGEEMLVEIVAVGVPPPTVFVCEKGMGGDQDKINEPPGSPGTNPLDPN